MRPLQIIVCLKQIPDPEAPPGSFKIDTEAKKITPVGIPPMINPFDENALETALRIKDKCKGTVRILSMGPRLSKAVFRKGIAAGGDELILLEDPLFKELDSFSTASVLASAIKKISPYDLILTGRQASDWDFGITGLLLAEMLQLPAVNLVRKVELRSDVIIAEQLSQNGYDVIETPLPALLTVSSEAGELRPTSLRALLSAGSKVRSYKAADLEIDPQGLETRKIVKLAPIRHQRDCRFVEGESAHEKCRNLVLLLRKDQIV